MDVRDAEFQGKLDSDQSESQISRLALDIGGSLIKLVYFSRKKDCPIDDDNKNNKDSVIEGKLHFAKFETSKIVDCLDFILSKKLHLGGCCNHEASASGKLLIKATGGGAYKFADLIKQKLGVSIEKEGEMDCLVAGANFLLKAVPQEAFIYMDGRKEFVHIDHNDLYPYLLVNMGSGVSMIKVDGDGQFERISGTSVGGGTFWGLGRLLTKCKSFDELLELSHHGNNRVIDMLVGDIYGGLDYSKIGLSSTTIASSFGKAISDNRELEDYKPEDIAHALLRMISNNIGQISYLNALQFGLKRIFFSGFFIRNHAFTMDTISVAVNFWSKSEAKAMFLRHEGFVGALGAFMSYENPGHDDSMAHQVVKRYPVCKPVVGDKICCPLNSDLNDNESLECSLYAL